MKMLKPHEQIEIEAYLLMVETGLTASLGVARGAATATLAPFTSGASDTALVQVLTKLNGDVHALRRGVRNGKFTLTV